MKSVISRCLTAVLALLFFVSNCVLAHALETNVWSERQRRLEQANNKETVSPSLAALPVSMQSNSSQVLNGLPLSHLSSITSSHSLQITRGLPSEIQSSVVSIAEALPSLFGSLRAISVPENRNGKTIVHIQDVHLNSEAQNNIGGAVRSLITSRKVGLIGLEGAFAPVHLSSFRSFADKDATRIVADYLLKENRISGAVHAALVSETAIPSLVGVDDFLHYNANVDAYKQSLPLKKEMTTQLKQSEAALTQEKKAVFGPALAAFDAKVQAYRNGSLSMGSYLQFLSQQKQTIPTEVEVFLEAWRTETSLDYAKVEKERNALLKALVKKSDKTQSAELLNASIAYRLGQIRHTDFYQTLRTLCEKNGLRLESFKAFDAYVQYVLLSDTINSEKLFRSVKNMEDEAYASLSKTVDEKRVMAQSAALHLTGKLVDFSLTPDEWKEYKSIVYRPWTIDYKLNLSSFERFYREAEARDAAITDNLLKAMEKQNVSVGVLVTGGFHSPGIDQRLADAGVVTLSFVPSVTKVDGEAGTSYLSAFVQEKTPLDQLFKGEKLFVSPSPVQLGLTAPLQQAVVQQKMSGTSSEEVQGRSGRLLVRFARDHKILTVAFVSSLSAVAAAYWSLSQLGFSVDPLFVAPIFLLVLMLLSLRTMTGRPLKWAVSPVKKLLILAMLTGVLGNGLSAIAAPPVRNNVPAAQTQGQNQEKTTTPAKLNANQFVDKVAQGLLNQRDPKTKLLPSYFGYSEYEDVYFTYDLAHNAMEFKLAGHQREAEELLDYVAARLKTSRNEVEAKKDLNGVYGIRVQTRAGEMAVEGVVSAMDIRSQAPQGRALLDYHVAPGPMAWLGMAFLQVNPKKYRTEAIRLGEGLLKMQDANGGIHDGNRSPTAVDVEPHMGTYAFFNMLGKVTQNPKWNVAADKAWVWFEKNALNKEKGTIIRGMSDGKPDTVHATDVYTWSIAEAADRMDLDTIKKLVLRAEQSLVDVTFTRLDGKTVRVILPDFTDPEAALIKMKPVGDSDGFRRGGYHPLGWIEGAGGFMLMYEVAAKKAWEEGDKTAAIDYLAKAGALHASIERAFSIDGRGAMVAPYATGQWVATGHGWRTPVWQKLGDGSASSAWVIFSRFGSNPFKLGEEEQVLKALSGIPVLPLKEREDRLRKAVGHPSFVEEVQKESPAENPPVKLFGDDRYEEGPWFGRYKTIHEDQSKAILQHTSLRVTVKPEPSSTLADLTGFTIDVIGENKQFVVSLYLKKSGGKWEVVDKGSSKAVVSENSKAGAVSVVIPMSEIKAKTSVIEQLHVQTGQQLHVQTGHPQSEKQMNQSNVRSGVTFEAFSDKKGAVVPPSSPRAKAKKNDAPPPAEPSYKPVEGINPFGKGSEGLDTPEQEAEKRIGELLGGAEDTEPKTKPVTPPSRPQAKQAEAAPASGATPDSKGRPLNEFYQGATWFGRWIDVAENSDVILRQQALRLTIKPPELEKLTGFHVDVKGVDETRVLGLFAKKVAGTWVLFNDDNEPLKGSKTVVVEDAKNGSVSITIPIAEIRAKTDFITQIHVQTGQQQDEVELNKANVELANGKVTLEVLSEKKEVEKKEEQAPKKSNPSIKQDSSREDRVTLRALPKLVAKAGVFLLMMGAASLSYAGSEITQQAVPIVESGATAFAQGVGSTLPSFQPLFGFSINYWWLGGVFVALIVLRLLWGRYQSYRFRHAPAFSIIIMALDKRTKRAIFLDVTNSNPPVEMSIPERQEWRLQAQAQVKELFERVEQEGRKGLSYLIQHASEFGYLEVEAIVILLIKYPKMDVAYQIGLAQALAIGLPRLKTSEFNEIKRDFIDPMISENRISNPDALKLINDAVEETRRLHTGKRQRTIPFLELPKTILLPFVTALAIFGSGMVASAQEAVQVASNSVLPIDSSLSAMGNFGWMAAVAVVPVALIGFVAWRKIFHPKKMGGLEQLADAITNALLNINGDQPNQNVLAESVAALDQVGPVGVEGGKGLFNLSAADRAVVIDLVKKKWNEAPRQSISLNQARSALLRLDGYAFNPMESVIGDSNLALDVKVQDETDIPLAVATIKAARASMGNGILYVPVKTLLSQSLKQALGPTAGRIEFISDDNGFFDGSIYNLELMLTVLGSDKLKNTLIHVQGEYRVTEATWEFYRQSSQLRLVVLELLNGLMRAVEVDRPTLENIDKVALPAIFA